ncbi:MAG: hypothetical protein GY797_33505 [Deltaproteobacteria bacterium]|nr:hypothetical protein [Deltaproteobacteria bacterium]
MKIFCTADWHVDNNEDFFKSLAFFVSQVKTEMPDLVTIAGDLFDRAQLNTSSSGFVRIQNAIKDILGICPIASIYGTPSHDVAGSLEVFKNMHSYGNDFNILLPGKWKTFHAINKGDSAPQVYRELDGLETIQVTGIPEINKAFYLNDNENATNEEISRDLAKFVYGLSSTRNKDLPSLVLFHGELIGTKLNENQVLPSGGIGLSDMDLLTIGADYYSCGHIHMRQFVTPKIRYEGSIYAKTWGERTTKAFTVVTTESKDLSLSEVLFPTQPMEKITSGSMLAAKIAKEHLADNTKLWLELEYQEEAFKALPIGLIDVQSKELLKMGYGPGSRVTHTVIKNETTRAIEIIATKSLFDKVMIWHKNSNTNELSVTAIDEIRKLCQGYENKLKAVGLSHDQRSLVLESLSLRGAIGIWKGTGKEDIEINFKDLNTGIVALLGDNGSGKSTIIKNCNPYPDSIDGGVGLKNSFFLKDSHSITIWRDQYRDVSYKCIKKINAESKSGKAEFFLMVNKGNAPEPIWEPYNEDAEFFLTVNKDNAPEPIWEPYNEDINGRKEPYKKAILDIFGSDEIFKRSVYIAQKGSALPQTVSERKALFNELLGNQYLESIHELIKEDFKTSIEKSEIIMGKLDVLESALVVSVPQVKEYIASSQLQITTLTTTIEELKTDEFETKKKNDFYSESINHYNQYSNEKQLLINDVSHIRDLVSVNTKLIDDQLDLVSKKRSIIVELEINDRIIDDGLGIKKKLADAEHSHDKAHTDYYNKIDGYNRIMEDYYKSVASLELTIKRNNNIASEKESLIKSINARLDLINKPCDKCGYLPDDITANIDKLNNEKRSLINDSELNRVALQGLKDDLDEIKTREFPEKPQDIIIKEFRGLMVKLKHDLDELTKKQLSDSDYANLKVKLKNIEQADDVIANTKEQIKSSNIEIDNLGDRIKLLEIKIESKNQERKTFEATSLLLNETKDAIVYHEKELAVLVNSKENAEQKLEENKNTINNIKMLKEDKRKYESIKNDLSILKTATSKDGIQALELDALTPAILDTANRLLTSIYGDKFSLSVETTRETTKGEQVEDFEIVVTDNEEDNYNIKNQKLSTLSGGEEVWILKAIYDAFAVVGERNTGLKYLTTFQDEADGALSPDKKHLYLRMIEAAHDETKRVHTIYVTHDQGIQELIKERIEL